MENTHVPSRVFRQARQDAETARGTGVSTPQTESPSYRLAFQDLDFLLREDLRPVRFQLELLKPTLLLDEARIASTFVFYGSARIPEPAKAQALLDSGVGKESAEFYRAKIQTAEFYFERLMPRANAHRTGALAPTKSVMQLDNEHFAFA